jgi:hypothetical protein
VTHDVATFVVEDSDNEFYFGRVCAAHKQAAMDSAVKDGVTPVVYPLNREAGFQCEYSEKRE